MSSPMFLAVLAGRCSNLPFIKNAFICYPCVNNNHNKNNLRMVFLSNLGNKYVNGEYHYIH